MAVIETVDDERGRVAVDSPVGLDVVAWQVRRPRTLDGAVGMELQLASF